MTDEDYMRLALKEAEIALQEGNYPIGCVIELDGEIIARTHNKSNTLHKLAHAETQAIQSVASILMKNKKRATLYTTYEPCPMCYGTCLLGRLKRVVAGVDLDRSGAFCLQNYLPPIFHQDLFDTKLTYGILERECAEIFMKGDLAKELIREGVLNLEKLERILGQAQAL